MPFSAMAAEKYEPSLTHRPNGLSQNGLSQNGYGVCVCVCVWCVVGVWCVSVCVCVCVVCGLVCGLVIVCV